MTDVQWLRIHSVLSIYSGIRVGKETHCPLCVEALRWRARMGTPWRQLPAAYGKWNSVYHRYANGCARGVWPRLMAYLQVDPDRSAVLLDSMVVRAHVSVAGARPNKEAEPALGRSRGDFSTKIHMLADRRGRPLHLRMTGGQRHDSIQARDLVEAWTDASLPCLIADWPYDGDAFRAWRERKGIEAGRPKLGAQTPSPTIRNGTKRATPWNGASGGSNASSAWLPAMTNARSVA